MFYQDLLLKKWIDVYDQSGRNYSVNKEIRIKKPMLNADLCDYSDVYIVVRGVITVTEPEKWKKKKKKKVLHLKIIHHFKDQ